MYRALSLDEIAVQTGAEKAPYYWAIYEMLFNKRREEPVALLELGVYQGGSIKAWEAYFPNGHIVGLDHEIPEMITSDRVRLIVGDQADIDVLDRAAEAIAPNGFDIIIDDCAHIGTIAKKSFWHLFDNHLKPGGTYAIEDWGTGYWETWPDGRKIVFEPDTRFRMPSHDAGMVGFIKQLIDELAVPDIKDRVTDPAPRGSKFEEILLYPAICLVRKSHP